MNETLNRVNWLEREDIVKILENNGFACYDSEDTDDLRLALYENIEDGTIPEDALNVL